MTNPITLKINQVQKSFPGLEQPLLDNISLTLRVAEKIAITGVSGSGKSTLAKVLAGVLPIDSGKVSIKGHHPTTPGESRSIGVAMVFQEVLVADESSVVDNLFIGADGFFTKSMSDKEKQQRAHDLMSELAGEYVDPLQQAGTLPLNIRAWITIARGFLCEPDLLILDESSAALDFDSTERLFQKMREMRDNGTAIIIVTHRIAELIRISDRCTVMRDGKNVGVLENVLRVLERWIYIHVFSMAFSTLEKESNLEKNGQKSSRVAQRNQKLEEETCSSRALQWGAGGED